MRNLWARSLAYKIGILGVAIVLAFALSTSAYAWYFSARIVPGTSVGVVSLSGLTQEQAAERMQRAIDAFQAAAIHIQVGNRSDAISAQDVGFDCNIAEAVERAYQRGHEGSFARQLGERISAMWRSQQVDAPGRIDEAALRATIDDIASAASEPRQDVRLRVQGTGVSALMDTRAGRTIDREDAFLRVRTAMASLNTLPITLELRDDLPQADAATAPAAVVAAQRMLARPLVLVYEDFQLFVARDVIGEWITSEYDGATLRAGLSRTAVATYVTTVAKRLNVAPEPARIETADGRVIGFTPPKVGRAVQEDVLTQAIIDTISARTDRDNKGDNITIPIKAARMALEGIDSSAGITELIGRATTPFTGSPKNRISNIKNGVKFLTGTIVAPGAEFSTLGTLGIIDNTTGYLPELVIKGDRTTPEYGGGLCQVSTTLFRATMDAGLPITARRNHSYRVSYYEKDGNGKVIGPGLDATIYEPNVDYKFVNDMATPVLIIGYVAGDKITFELYGTHDGRTGKVVGPTMLTETTPGDPVYIETTDLAPGVIKQVETPHPGGSAVAVYTISYADGRVATQEFKSWYRRWPAKYLKGVLVLSSPSPTP